MANNGYTRLKARFEEQAKRLAELEQAELNTAGKYEQALKDLSAYKRKCENLNADNERLRNARDGYRKTVENLQDREGWLLRHTLGIIRFWYVKHFGL